MPKVLTVEQIERYRRDGYVSPIRLMAPDQAASLTAQLEKLEAEVGGEAQHKLWTPYLVYQWLYELVTHPRMLDAVEDVLGPNLLCWGGGFFEKNPGDKRFISWHQDTFYYGLDPAETCTAWFAFTPSNLQSGCVHVLPGSHRGNPNLEFVNEPNENNMLARGQTIKGLDLSAARPVILDAGEFSLHHESIVHGSDANNSEWRRIGISIHYISPDVRRVKYNAVSQPSALLVRGVDTFGHWQHEPAPVGSFDGAAAQRVIKAREEFFRRSKNGEIKEAEPS